MDPEDIVSPEYGAGRLLTDARLKLGLEQDNVAEMLHLRVHQIRALEADDYDNLPEPTYVKGYLRAYCQLLSLNADEIVGLYTRHANPPVKASYEGLVSEKQAVSSDNLIKLASVALVVLIAGLAVVYWMSASDKSPPAEMAATPLVDQPPAYTPENAAENGIGNTDQPVSNEDKGDGSQHIAEKNPEVMSNAGSGVSAGSAGKTENSAVKTQEVVAAPPTTLAPAATMTPGTAQTQSPGAGNTKADSSATRPMAQKQVAERARSRLVIKTTNTSWIDVRDVYDNKLIYETVPAGREIPLEGLAPFKVFIGNAVGVQIFVEGKIFDYSRFKRGQTARFSLNVEEGNR